jgi:hypothetical protein
MLLRPQTSVLGLLSVKVLPKRGKSVKLYQVEDQWL